MVDRFVPTDDIYNIFIDYYGSDRGITKVGLEYFINCSYSMEKSCLIQKW